MIIFEGITGSGKSEQINLIRQSSIEDFVVCGSDNPIYETTKNIRSDLKKLGSPLIPETFLHQFTNYMKIDGYHQKELIVDRFVLSNLVYFFARCEIGKVSIDKGRCRNTFLDPFGFGLLNDSLTLFLDCSPTTAKQRTTTRPNDRNNFNYELQNKAKEIYNQEIELYPYKIAKINADRNKTEVFQDIQKVLGEYLR